MRVEAFFIVPISFFLENRVGFYLMPDNGDNLYLDIITDFFILWEGEIVAKSNKVCCVCKCVISPDHAVEMKTQTLEFINIETYYDLKRAYPEAADKIAQDAIDNLSLATVKDLQITQMYAGRTIDELFLFYPELIGKVQDINIA